MPYIIAGLGNPGEEYKDTRHNAGRIVVEYLGKTLGFSDFSENQKLKALISKGEISSGKKKEKIDLVLPDNFMNCSGSSLTSLVSSVKKAHNLIVIYDDLDLGLGTIKISYNRSSGGHRGLESIIKALKTQEFIRVRVGISPVTPSGKVKKPKGEDKVEKHIIGPFTKSEMDVMKKIAKKGVEAVQVIMFEGKEKAMEKFNA